MSKEAELPGFTIMGVNCDLPGFKDLTQEQFMRMMQPNSLPSSYHFGEWPLDYIEVKGCRFYFNWEMHGIQVGWDYDAISRAEAQTVVVEISQNIAQAAKVQTRVVISDVFIQVWPP